MQITSEPIGTVFDLIDEMRRNTSANGIAAPLLSSEFLQPLFRHLLEPGVKLLVGREQQELVMVLPIIQKKFGVYETFSPSQLTVTCLLTESLSIDRGFIRQCAKALGSPILMLSMLDFDPDAFPKVEVDPRIVEVRPYADTMSIDLSGDFESYWSKRSKKLRDNIKRYVNRFEKAGHTLNLRINESPVDVSEALARYAQIEQAGWKGQQGTAIDLDQPQGKFYAASLEALAASDGARILELLVDGDVVSSRVAIRSGDNAVFLKTTYNEAFKKFSPGRILLHHTLEYLFGLGLSQVEFYTKVTPDQAQWSTSTRPVQHLELHSSSLLQRVRRWQFNSA